MKVDYNRHDENYLVFDILCNNCKTHLDTITKIQSTCGDDE